MWYMATQPWESHHLAQTFIVIHNEITRLTWGQPTNLPYVMEVNLKWNNFAAPGVLHVDFLQTWPGGVLRVVLWDIWKDFLISIHGPYGKPRALLFL